MNKEIKLQTKILVVSICLVVLTVIGSSYAAFVWSNSGSSQNISSGNYVIEIENTTGNSINLSGTYPMSDEDGKKTTSYKFTVHNKSNTDVEFKLKLENDTSKTNTMDISNIKVYLTGANIITPKILSMIPNNTLDSGYLNANSSKTYELRVWIDENASNDTIGKEYNGKLTLDTKQLEISDVEYQRCDVNMNGIIDPLDRSLVSHRIGSKINLNTLQEKLADANGDGVISALDLSYILRNTNKNLLTYKLDLSTNEGSDPNFSSDSTDKGLFVQVSDKTKTENGYPVIYYRGAVENNYVQLGTYKNDITNKIYNPETASFETKIVAHTNDPILWRIVSINTDGSIKLISEYNTENEILFNSQWSSKYINNNGSNSEIKTELERWYNTHISVDKNIDSKIMKANYCNDITGIIKSNLGNALRRLIKIIPTFICPEGSIVDNNKVGALTGDELMFSGVLFRETVEKSTTYLDNNTIFWTMTPSYDDENLLYFVNNKRIDSSFSCTDAYSARPVITLKPNVEVSSGSGKSTDPYIIKL